MIDASKGRPLTPAEQQLAAEGRRHELMQDARRGALRELLHELFHRPAVRVGVAAVVLIATASLVIWAAVAALNSI